MVLCVDEVRGGEEGEGRKGGRKGRGEREGGRKAGKGRRKDPF